MGVARKPADRTALRLYSPSENDSSSENSAPAASPAEAAPAESRRTAPAADWTLSEFYRRYAEPVVLRARGARPRNLEQYDGSVRTWAKLTGDPPLSAVDDRTCAEFVAALRQQKNGRDRRSQPGAAVPISPNTVRKHCMHLQALFDLLGPRDRRKRRLAVGLFSDPPYLTKPRARPKAVADLYCLEQLAEFVQAAALWTATPRILPRSQRGLWWKSLLLLSYNTALRIGSLMTLRWSDVRIVAGGGELLVPADPDRIKGGHGQTVPLNATALELLAELREVTGYQAMVFPWNNRPWPTGHSWLYRQLHRIQAEAGLPREFQLGLHALRKTGITELSRINPAAAQLLAGHASEVTTRKHYTGQVVLTDGLSALPQPELRHPIDGGEGDAGGA